MKRIVVLIDGTWQQEGVGRNTNVGLLDTDFKIDGFSLIKSCDKNGVRQVVEYHKGVGAVTKSAAPRNIQVNDRPSTASNLRGSQPSTGWTPVGEEAPLLILFPSLTVIKTSEDEKREHEVNISHIRTPRLARSS